MLNSIALTTAHWLFSCLLIVDRLIEPQTVVHFLEYCDTGDLPNGKVTTLPLPDHEEELLWMKPYSEWAPAPYNNITEDLGSQLMIRVGSDDDYERLELIPYNIHSWKSTLLDDMVPLSPTQWKDKRLSQPENFDLACEYLIAVIAAFEYLNLPQAQEKLKGTYNVMYDHFEYFDNAVNSLRSSNGKEGTVSMAALWEEFTRVHYQTVTARAHSWVISHATALRGPILNDLIAHQPPSEHSYSPKQQILTDKLHVLAEITTTADFTILLPMDGYKGHVLLEGTEGDLHSPSLDIRRDAVSDRVKSLSNHKMLTEILVDTLKPESDRTPRGVAHPESLLKTALYQIDAQTETREALRGKPEQLPPPGWIMRIQRRISFAESNATNSEPYQLDKFTIYKLVYSQTDEEWSDFLQKLEADMNDWGHGVQGADQIKERLQLEWFDGEELGIPEDDIDAAKK
ncbi:uncharacterized protein GIQ15_00883 [Arthroderma uncinatum]|uniref:uncharacterized protein n=1 Tax=Arthroderma uncinatum TaxID=74035 RepID=UPI00144AD415|nr:uncharacterized protein GIQ15_00883 [Arthroderma uncinatum]KAF3491366.1 hypothetical protein GIQ15_00883 [Arthroderma uncinatum]